MDYWHWQNLEIPVIRQQAVVVGSGAAGLAAAWHLSRLQVGNFCLITENMNAGTSRNTGSDKQTYYKLTLAGSETDSVSAMAQTLFEGGSMDGDLARVEAALSAGCFNRLCDLGVPFPLNRFGEAAGYKTDHDPRQRATSAGPLTSRIMTEALQKAILEKGVTVYDRWQVIKILTDNENARVCGLLCLNLQGVDDENDRYKIIACDYIIYAVGGPAMIYADSVYPTSQCGASGLALEAGASGKNLTEWQYGLASVKPRWNVSGSFQQVLPRYWSAEPDGTGKRDFLDDILPDYRQQMTMIFRKGYEWPFDFRKISESSLIDILVYQETILKGRKVYLDFRSNPGGIRIDWTKIEGECADYLRQAHSVQELPIERLYSLNQPAAEFYLNNGVDLVKEPLEIKLCAQHHNGGLAGDIWWQSDLRGLFPIGEVNGSHGIYRPGGSALNSGQAGAARAAEWISRQIRNNRKAADGKVPQPALKQVGSYLSWLDKCLRLHDESESIHEKFYSAQMRMSKVGGAFREIGLIREAILDLRRELESIERGLPAGNPKTLSKVCRYRELIFTQSVFLSAMLDYLETGGGSRGSSMCLEPDGKIPAAGIDQNFRCRPLDMSRADQVQEVKWQDDNLQIHWRPVRDLPESQDVFEVVWKHYRAKQ